MSIVKVNSIMSRTGSGQVTVATGNQLVGADTGSIYAPGMIIQVVNTFLTDQFTVSVPASTVTLTNITGLTASITPRSTSSRIYVVGRWFGEASAAGQWNMMWNIKRDDVVIGQPIVGSAKGITMAALSYNFDNYSTTPEMAMFDYLDSPSSTSAVTYQICVTSGSAFTLYTNRTVSVDEGGTSSITLFEVA